MTERRSDRRRKTRIANSLGNRRCSMRPCQKCGQPLRNNQATCDACRSVQEEAAPNRESETAPVDSLSVHKRSSSATILLVLAELFLRTVMLAIPLSALAAGLAYLVLWNQSALFVGAAVGVLFSAGYNSVEMYFRNQVFRGPLG